MVLGYEVWGRWCRLYRSRLILHRDLYCLDLYTQLVLLYHLRLQRLTTSCRDYCQAVPGISAAADCCCNVLLHRHMVTHARAQIPRTLETQLTKLEWSGRSFIGVAVDPGEKSFCGGHLRFFAHTSHPHSPFRISLANRKTRYALPRCCRI